MHRVNHAALLGSACDFIVLLAAGLAAAGEGPTGALALVLRDGIAPRAAGQIAGKDLDLEVMVRDGQWQDEVWAYALWFNRADHPGTLTKAEQVGDTLKLTVELAVQPDKWVKGGPATYAIELKKEGDRYVGTYTGSFLGQAVQGAASGPLLPWWRAPADAAKALTPAEHPRLIFRKRDLPELRKRMETPEGKAMLARLEQVLERNHASNTKNQPFYAAGFAIAHQLTGKPEHAARAKSELAKTLKLGGSQDIHYGPLALGIALTLDHCYEAWDAGFRQQVIDNLAKRARDLIAGRNIGTYAPNPWHNHNGVRAPSAGLAALCLLGEKTTDGAGDEDLARAVHVIARDTRRYFTMGLGDTGWCLEGAFYKRMTWNSGPGHFIQAYRSALGGELIAGLPGAYSILGEWMEQPPADKPASFDLGNHESSGLWPVGLAAIPADKRAGMRWIYDRAFGLEGTKTFGIHWGMHAAYALMNYPFDVAAEPPATSLPWAAPDLRAGHFIFRKPWKDAQDTLAVLHYRHQIFGGCHWERSGQTGDMQLFALGKQWIGADRLSEDTGAGGALTTVPGLFNDFLGGEPIHYQATPDGIATISWRMDDLYLKALEKNAAAPADAKVVTNPRGGRFVDHGVRARRHLGLDLSGACGAPVLLVTVDEIDGAESAYWNLRIAKDAGAPAIEGARVTIGDPAGAHLRGQFVAPAGVTLAGRLQASGGTRYFAVFTVQSGAAPDLKVTGEGLDATVAIGGRTVAFEGGKVVFGAAK